MKRRVKMLISVMLMLVMTVPSALPTGAVEIPTEPAIIIRTWNISDVATGTDDQVLTVSGSAISLGGNASLADGIVLVTPEEGDSLQSIQTETNDLNYESALEFMEGSIYQRLPENVRDTISNNSNGYIIYISKSYYMNKHGRFDIIININNETEGLKQYVVNVKPSSLTYGNNELEPGSIYNPFQAIDTLRDAVSSLPANSDNWYVTSRGTAAENTVFDISDGTDGKEFGEMLIKDYGSRSLYIKSKVDGREWEIFFNVRLGAEQPLSRLLVNANGEEFSWLPYNSEYQHNNPYYNVPKYILRPQEGSELVVYNDALLTFDILPGAEIIWSESKYNGRYLLENELLSFDDMFNFEGNDISNPINILTDTEARTIHITAEGNLESDILDLVIKKEDKTYNYEISFMRNSNISFSMKYVESFCVPSNQPIDMFEYFFWSHRIPADKPYILERINSGQYTVNIAGAQILYENGIFNGNIKFTKPGFYAYIYDTHNKLIVSSGDLSVYMRNNYILSAGDTLNLEDSLNMSLDIDSQEVVMSGNSEAYQLDGFVITAKEVSESNSVTARVSDKYNGGLLGIITIKIVGSNDDMETVIGDTVDEIAEGAVLNININSVSESIFNRLTNKNGYMSLLNKNVVWTFDGQNISVNKAKDVDLNVNVGTVLDENAKKEILRIVEEAEADSILLDFPENGELPGPASMKISLTSEQVEGLKNQNGIYLYYFNKETNRMEKEDADIKVEQDYNGNYYAQFTLTHNSDFVLSTNHNLESVVVIPEEPTGPTTPEEPTEPTPETPDTPAPEEPTNPTPDTPAPVVPSDPTPVTPGNPTPVIPSEPTPTVPVATPTPAPIQEKAEDTMELQLGDGSIKLSVKALEDEEEVKVSLELPKDMLESISDTAEEIVIPVSTSDINKFIANSNQTNVNIEVKAPNKLLAEGNRASINLNTELLEMLKTEKKELTVSVRDETGKSRYEWSISGNDLAGTDKELGDINLSLTTQYVKDIEAINELTKQKNQGLVINFNHNGVLPAQAKVRVYVGDMIGKDTESGIVENKKVYVYHYNSSTGKLDTLPYSSNYKVDKDGYIELMLLHCSDYVVLPKEADSKAYTSLRNQISVDVKNKALTPKKTANIEVKLPATLEIVDNKTDKSRLSAMGTVTVTYTSNNKAVATVDNNGKITAKKAGTATITTKVTLYSGKTKVVRTKIFVK